MINQYTRTTLLIDKEKLKKLFNKRVAIFGLGGVGGNVVESLARSGIGEFDLIDNDEFSITNINRQILSSLKTIGKAKVDVAEERIHDINPTIVVHKHKTFYLPENKKDFDFSKFDYIVDAIDTVSAKIDIICEANRLNIPIISAMGCGNRLDPTKLVLTDIYKTSNDPLSKVMRHELRKRGITSLKVVYSTENAIKPKEMIEKENITSKVTESFKGRRSTPGSTSFVPPVAGTLIGYQVFTDLLDSEDNDLNYRDNNPFD